MRHKIAIYMNGGAIESIRSSVKDVEVSIFNEDDIVILTQDGVIVNECVDAEDAEFQWEEETKGLFDIY